eukprot:6225483-Prymnesium_polylepis.1
MELQAAPELLAGRETTNISIDMIVCGSNARCPYGVWDAVLEDNSAMGTDTKVGEEVPFFAKPALGSARAMRVPIENFAGYYRSQEDERSPSPLRLIVDAAGHTKDFSAFGSECVE